MWLFVFNISKRVQFQASFRCEQWSHNVVAYNRKLVKQQDFVDIHLRITVLRFHIILHPASCPIQCGHLSIHIDLRPCFYPIIKYIDMHTMNVQCTVISFIRVVTYDIYTISSCWHQSHGMLRNAAQTTSGIQTTLNHSYMNTWCLAF